MFLYVVAELLIPYQMDGKYPSPVVRTDDTIVPIPDDDSGRSTPADETFRANKFFPKIWSRQPKDQNDCLYTIANPTDQKISVTANSLNGESCTFYVNAFYKPVVGDVNGGEIDYTVRVLFNVAHEPQGGMELFRRTSMRSSNGSLLLSIRESGDYADKLNSGTLYNFHIVAQAPGGAAREAESESITIELVRN